MRRESLAALIVGGVLSIACKDPGPDMALGPPTTFRLALFRDQFDTGVDLEIRIPSGYESDGFSPFTRMWDRRRGVGFSVTTDPERQRTLAVPCGKPNYGWSETVAARVGSAEDMTFVCESRMGEELHGVSVIRLFTSIDTVIQCEAAPNVRVMTAEEKAAALAICGSLRVLGRSTWTPADYLEPGSDSLKNTTK